MPSLTKTEREHRRQERAEEKARERRFQAGQLTAADWDAEADDHECIKATIEQRLVEEPGNAVLQPNLVIITKAIGQCRDIARKVRAKEEKARLREERARGRQGKTRG